MNIVKVYNTGNFVLVVRVFSLKNKNSFMAEIKKELTAIFSYLNAAETRSAEKNKSSTFLYLKLSFCLHLLLTEMYVFVFHHLLA